MLALAIFRIFGLISDFFIEILIDIKIMQQNFNFGRKLKFSSKIKTLARSPNFGENPNFSQKAKNFG